MKVKATIHIESMKKFYVGELDKAEFDLILQLGSSSTVKLLRNSIDTTKKATKKKKGLLNLVIYKERGGDGLFNICIYFAFLHPSCYLQIKQGRLNRRLRAS